MSSINNDPMSDKESKDNTLNGNQHLDLISSPQQTSDNAEVELLEKDHSKTNSVDVAVSVEEKENFGRETWGKKIDFLLSVIGFAVDLANVWRFPYLCYKNGGGAFLIPYVSMLVIGGVPLFYMELALGQFIRQGAITCWGKICPLLKGLGFCVVMIAFYTDFFYNVLITWSLYYFFKSFALELPWTSCSNEWNTNTCQNNYLIDNYNSSQNSSAMFAIISNATNMTDGKITYPADEFYRFAVLGREPGITIENLGKIQIHLAICLLLVYVICYFSLWKGISMSGKVVWFTAVFPYIVLIILFFRGITLEGAMTGVYKYVVPDLKILTTPQPWVDAATQVFFSLGPGFGVLLAFASYNKFHNNVYKDALFTSAVNSCTSFLSGFVVFSVLGYMAHKRQVDFKDVISADPGLVFTVYPEALSTLPGSTFWSLIFFLMLLTLGLDSSFGGSEAVVTAFSDEFPIIRRRREIFLLCLFVFYYMIGLVEVTQGGMFIFQLFEKYCVNYSILIAVLFETVCISWIYGVDRFRDNIKEMVGFRPGNYWKICWKYIAPVFILVNIVFGMVNHENLTLDDYKYPLWVDCVGWALAASSVLFIPGTAIFQLIRTKGTFRERMKILTTPLVISRPTLSNLNQTNEMEVIIKVPSDDCPPTEDV